MTLRWKLALAFTVTAAIVLAGLGRYLDAATTENTVANVQNDLLGEVRLAALAVPPPPWRPDEKLQALFHDLDERSDARVTLIGSSGEVIADSRHDTQSMENHAGRPERVQALEQGWGSALRHSDTLKVDMLYVALRLSGTGGPAPVLRVAKPLTEVQAASEHLRRILATAFILGVCLIWLVSFRLADALTAPVQALVRAAQRVGRGDLQARVGHLPGKELSELAQVFDDAVARLSHLIATSQREGRYYAAILEQMSDAVVIVDREGRVEFVNPTFARVFKLEGSDEKQTYLEQITLNYDVNSLLQRAVQQGTVQRDEVRVLYPETRFLAIAATPLTGESDQVVGAVGLLRDVTDLRRLDEVRRDFVANASHELRTPAAGIRALAEALQAGALKDPEKGSRFVQQIVDAAERLTQILDDMLTLTRVERGRELLVPSWLAPTEAFEKALAQVRPAASRKRIALRAQVAEQDRMYADPASVQTVLINLLDNAVKYTPDEGNITLSGRAVAGGYEVSVQDTGIGIPPEHLSRIFERFYRVDKARDRATGGTGLGLSIVKHIAEVHGGRAAVTSIPNDGSTFTVRFPSPETPPDSPDQSPRP